MEREDAGMDHGVLRGVATGNEAPIVDRNRQRVISDIDVGEEKKKREKRERGKKMRGEDRLVFVLYCRA